MESFHVFIFGNLSEQRVGVRSRVIAMARAAPTGRRGCFDVTASPVSRDSCFGQPLKCVCMQMSCGIFFCLFCFSFFLFCLLFKEVRSFSWYGKLKRTGKSACTLGWVSHNPCIGSSFLCPMKYKWVVCSLCLSRHGCASRWQLALKVLRANVAVGKLQL